MRSVKHFWNNSWPDHGVPSSPDVIFGILDEVKKERESSHGPVVVHCSAGCGTIYAQFVCSFVLCRCLLQGRTGVVIGVDIVRDQVDMLRRCFCLV